MNFSAKTILSYLIVPSDKVPTVENSRPALEVDIHPAAVRPPVVDLADLTTGGFINVIRPIRIVMTAT